MPRRLPEKWTLLRENPPTYDPTTGNTVPVAPTEVNWTGLLQLRLLDSQEQHELSPGTAVSEMVLLLDPGLPGGTDRRDTWRFDGPAGVNEEIGVGGKVTVQGNPRTRRPARGSRRPAYISAIVKHASDME